MLFSLKINNQKQLLHLLNSGLCRFAANPTRLIFTLTPDIIGKVTSRLMLTVIRGRQFKNAGQCAAFIGVIPKLQESGVFRGRTTLSKKGNPMIRAKLYMAAIVAGQYNPDIQAQKLRLIKNGKTKMQALGAAMRKLVHICFGVLKTQTEYSQQAA